MMRVSFLLVSACCLMAVSGSLAKVSVGPHIPRWSASAISVNVDDSGENHIVGYFDEPAKRSLMQMDWPESSALFSNSVSMLCVEDSFFFFNSTDCFRFEMGGDSCFTNPMDFRAANAQGECGTNGQQLWVHPRGAKVCIDKNNNVKKLAISDEDSFEIDTFRWFQRSVSSQAGFWAPPSYCGTAHTTRLTSSLFSAQQQGRPNTLSGLARDLARGVQLVR